MKPEDILDFCLKEIEAGRKTAAECAAEHPDVPDLEALLRAAATLRAAPRPSLAPEASRKIENRLRQAVRTRAQRSVRRPNLALRWAPALVIAALLFAGVGTVAASSDSLPGQPLYAVKRAGESVQLALTPPSGQASLHTAFAQRRLDELVALSTHGPLAADVLNDLAADLTAETEAALASVDRAAPEHQAEVLDLIVSLTERQQAVLESVRAAAPEQAQAGLARALEASSEAHQRAAERLKQVRSQKGAPGAEDQTNAPTHVPPGQEKKTETAPDATATPHMPPGQQKRTETPAGDSTDVASDTPEAGGPGHGRGRLNCPTSIPKAHYDCTPTPSPTRRARATPGSATPTACPTNPAARPRCKP